MWGWEGGCPLGANVFYVHEVLKQSFYNAGSQCWWDYDGLHAVLKRRPLHC